MELVRGTPLDHILKSQGPLSLERFVPLLDRICEVVHTAHEQGIVHRDLKPANVMVLSRAGRLLPKLLDLGIAKGLAGAAEARAAADDIATGADARGASSTRPRRRSPRRGRQRPVDGAHRARRDHGIAALHGAGAVARCRARRRAHRSLRARDPRVRVPHRQAAVHRSDDHRDRDRARDGGPGAARSAVSGRARQGVREGAREGGRRSLPRCARARGRVSPGRRASPARPAAAAGDRRGAARRRGSPARRSRSPRRSPRSRPRATRTRRAMRSRSSGGRSRATSACSRSRVARGSAAMMASPRRCARCTGARSPIASGSISRGSSRAAGSIAATRIRSPSSSTRFTTTAWLDAPRGARSRCATPRRHRATSCARVVLLDVAVARSTRVLEALAFLRDYPLVVTTGGGYAERWMGVRRTPRSTIAVRGKGLAAGEPALLDREGAPVLSLAPLFAIAAPTPGAPIESVPVRGPRPARREARRAAVGLRAPRRRAVGLVSRAARPRRGRRGRGRRSPRSEAAVPRPRVVLAPTTARCSSVARSSSTRSRIG